MTDPNGLCLWAGTLAGHNVWTRLRAAGRAGFASLSAAPCELAEVVDSGAARRLERELDAHGVRLSCLDPVAGWLPGAVAAHPAHRAHAAVDARRCLDLAERFGIDRVNAIDVTWRPLPRSAPALLAEFAEQARSQGVTVLVEAQIYSAVPTLGAALALCRDCGPDVRLMVDSWHWFRAAAGPAPASSGLYGTAGTDRLEGRSIGALQLSDGPARPAADPVTESTTGRLLPGKGAFDLARLVTAAPRDCLVGPEVFTADVAAPEQAEPAASAALAATRGVLRTAATL